MSQSKRLAALAKFRAGERDVLVATDVAARGLDIPAVDAVINYDLPGNPKDYVHRVGRTARAGRTGRALTLVTQYDVETYQRIEQLIGKKLPAYDVSRDELALIGDRVGEATRLAMAQMKEADSKKGKKRSKVDDDDGAFGGDAGGKPLKPQGRPRSGPGGGKRR
ncbi:hypothetical protein H632_c3682p0 [Helicosporidium sp. ATCC 50920]|nr:hypothetical protein H632_c3682p0 [Helicosporidium sp. ATCC 50920]|eukprot:KDD72218.1 hypothetical protein H632_c3682p0 [Helicosporidium sp. ATCC 50920]